MKKDSKSKDLDSLTFEVAIERLEGLVSRMESGKLQLDEMVKCFEEGSALSSACEKKLKDLERKIEILVKNGQDAKWKDFKSSDDSPAEREDAVDSGLKRSQPPCGV